MEAHNISPMDTAKDTALYQVVEQMQTNTQAEDLHTELAIDESKKMASKKVIERDLKFKQVVSNFPEGVKERFVALGTITKKREELSRELEKKILELERKCDLDCAPLDKLRKDLINGTREPTAEELKDITAYTITNTKGIKGIDVKELEESKGIPKFWSKAIQNSPLIKGFILDFDIPVLDNLLDVYKERLEGNSYRLIFKFAPNDYFTNEELVKTIIVSDDDPDDCKETGGTEINWNEGKNVTKKTIKKRAKKGGSITKTVDVASFFNYFKPKKVPTDKEMEKMKGNEEEMKIIEDFNDDLDITEEIAAEVIPCAIYYYFGLVKDEEEDAYEGAKKLLAKNIANSKQFLM